MRKIIVSEFVTLDGVMESPGGDGDFKYGGWSMPYWDDEIGKFKFEELFASDALLLGRLTYEGFAKAWPSVKDEAGFADRMNGIKKHVVSNSLTSADWHNSAIIKGDVVQQIKQLKGQDGQNILVAGSGALIRTLAQHDLVDEYDLLVYPVTLGEGKRLFREGAQTKLKLLESKTYPSGVALLRYQLVSTAE